MIEIFEMIVVVCRSRGVVNAALIYYKLVFHRCLLDEDVIMILSYSM